MFRPNPYGTSRAERLNWLCYTSGGAPDVMVRYLARDLEREQRRAIQMMRDDLVTLKSALQEIRQSIKIKAGFNPNQPRDERGRWAGGAGDDQSEEGEGENGVGLFFAANDGTPGSNQAQNKQFNDVVRLLGLNKDQRRQLHDEIHGQNLGFQEILRIGREIRGQ